MKNSYVFVLGFACFLLAACVDMGGERKNPPVSSEDAGSGETGEAGGPSTSSFTSPSLVSTTSTADTTSSGGSAGEGTGGNGGQGGSEEPFTPPCNGTWTALSPLFTSIPLDTNGNSQTWYNGGVEQCAYGTYFDQATSTYKGLIAEIDPVTNTLTQSSAASELGVNEYRKVLVFPNGDVVALGMSQNNGQTDIVAGPNWQVVRQLVGYPQDMCGTGLDDLYVLTYQGATSALTHISSTNPFTLTASGGPNALACIDGHVFFSTEDVSGNPAGPAGFYEGTGGVLTSLATPLNAIRIRGIVGHDVNHLYLSYQSGWFNGSDYSYRSQVEYYENGVLVNTTGWLNFLPVNLQSMDSGIVGTIGSLSTQPVAEVFDQDLVTQATWSFAGLLSRIRGIWQADAGNVYAAGSLDNHDQIVVCTP